MKRVTQNIFLCALALCCVTAFGQSNSIVTVSGNYTVVTANRLLLVNAASSAITITLSPATLAGQIIDVVVRNGTNNITVVKSGSDVLIDPTGGRFMGGGTCGSGESATFESDGSGNWICTQSHSNSCGNWAANADTVTGRSQVPIGTASGELLYWDATNKKWVVSNRNITAKLSTTDVTGLEVHVAHESGGSLSSASHFIDFFDGGGKNRGGVIGQTVDEMTNDPVWQANSSINDANIALGVAQAAIGVATVAVDADPFSAPAGVVLGLQTVATLAQTAVQTAQYVIITKQLKSQAGVNYSSSSGDYAEYLEREDARDRLYPGDIVGVRNGRISKFTEGAQNVFAVSLAPVVTGNVPPDSLKSRYNKVGFLGQVPVKVRGAVHAGDFIVASGLNDGIGVAIASDVITSRQFASVVGRAWTDVSTTNPNHLTLVNVAVGMNTTAMSELMSRQENELSALRDEVRELRGSTSELASIKARLENIEQGRASHARVHTASAKAH